MCVCVCVCDRTRGPDTEDTMCLCVCDRTRGPDTEDTRCVCVCVTGPGDLIQRIQGVMTENEASLVAARAER